MSTAMVKIVRNGEEKLVSLLESLPIQDIQISLIDAGILFKTYKKFTIAAESSVYIRVVTPALPEEHHSLIRRLKVQAGGPLDLEIYSDPATVVGAAAMPVKNLNGQSDNVAVTTFETLTSFTGGTLFDSDFIPVGQAVGGGVSTIEDKSIAGRIIDQGQHEFVVKITNTHGSDASTLFYEYLWYEPQAE